MKVNLDQALQQGIAAHREGKRQDAERLYRLILRAQPQHPHANHNLGVIFVSINNSFEALSLFKAAVRVNPDIDQFWFSYISALIAEQVFETAETAIAQASKHGVDHDRLSVFKGQLSSLHKNDRWRSLVPSKQLQKESQARIINYCKEGRLDDAERLASSFTIKFPKHVFGWKSLGAVFAQAGRLPEALKAAEASLSIDPLDVGSLNNMGNMLMEMGRWEESAENLRKAISISPNFAEAHINLGTTLGKLNRLEEAAISLERAIALQPESVDALCNYSNTLRVLGRLDEAEITAKQAVNLKPDNAASHHSLGNIQMDLNMLEEARASYARAIALMPKHAHAHSNLGTALLKLGELNDSVASYQQALTLKPDDAEFMMHLSTALGCIHALDAEALVLKDLMQLDPDYFGLRAGVNLAIHEFLKGNSEACEKYLAATSCIEAKMSSTFANERAYRKYLLAILAWRHKNNFRPEPHAADQCLHIIGDSHSLASHNLRVELPGGSFVGNARLIKGCKQWHLGNSANNEFKYQFETIFRSLPKSSEVLLVIGEIDCRIDSGIIKHKRKHPAKVLEDIIQATVSNYVNYVSTVNADYQHSITIQGVPCPNVNMKSSSTQDTELLVETIRLLNNQLRVESNRAAFGFLDVHELTDSGDGVSSGIWHLDSYHLSPAGVYEAWGKNYTQQHK